LNLNFSGQSLIVVALNKIRQRGTILVRLFQRSIRKLSPPPRLNGEVPSEVQRLPPRLSAERFDTSMLSLDDQISRYTRRCKSALQAPPEVMRVPSLRAKSSLFHFLFRMKNVKLKTHAKICDHFFNNCLDSRSIWRQWRCWRSSVDRSCAARNRGHFYHNLICDWETWTASDLIRLIARGPALKGLPDSALRFQPQGPFRGR
jgi:hypothetical protein